MSNSSKTFTTAKNRTIPITRIRREAKAQAQGAAEGEIKAHLKQPLLSSLRSHLGNMIDRIDPLEIAAIASSTVIIQPYVITSAEFLDKQQWIKAAIQPESLLWFIEDMLSAGLFPPPSHEEILKVAERIKKGILGDVPQLTSWLIAFIISFIFIRHFGEIVTAMGNITKSIGTLTGWILGGAVA